MTLIIKESKLWYTINETRYNRKRRCIEIIESDILREMNIEGIDRMLMRRIKVLK